MVLSNGCGTHGFSLVSVLFDKSMQYIICFLIENIFLFISVLFTLLVVSVLVE